MKLELRKFPDPILSQKTAKVKDPLTPEIQDLILNMIATMRAENGVGLAAPQVGQSLRLCVIQEDGIDYVLVNPTITSKSKTKIISEEGCLSIPGEFFPIPRHEKVQVRYLDKDGKEAKLKAGGLLARALQHEIDHLDGILIIERILKPKKKPNPESKNKKTDAKKR